MCLSWPRHGGPICSGLTTIVMRPSTRLRLRKLAAQFGFLIVEDDYDHEFHFDHQPLLPLASNDASGQILYVGLFSKILSPCLRVGFVAGPRGLIEQIGNWPTLACNACPAAHARCSRRRFRRHASVSPAWTARIWRRRWRSCARRWTRRPNSASRPSGPDAPACRSGEVAVVQQHIFVERAECAFMVADMDFQHPQQR